MTELEIKETLGEIVKIFDDINSNAIRNRIKDETCLTALSRFEDIMNHIDAKLTGLRAEIDCLKVRVEKLEGKR